jgi:hypothetical protein
MNDQLTIPMWAVLFRLADGERYSTIKGGTRAALERRGLIEHGALTEKAKAMIERVHYEVRS